MNPGYQSSASPGPSPAPQKRGGIAVQACDTCRGRKQKCDEQRPKCGYCQRANQVCHYRPVPPTKKGRTDAEIIDRLINIERKVDRISPYLPHRDFGPAQHASASQAAGSFTSSFVRQSHGGSPVGTGPPPKPTSVAHRILMWPVIQELLQQGHGLSSKELRNMEVDGSTYLVQAQRGSQVLPSDEILIPQPFLGMQMQATRESGGPRVTFQGLNYNVMHDLATSYFDTFNLIYPFMDRQNFISDTLAKVNSEGFNGDADSVIALLIFALGELALQAIQGDPIDVFQGRPSGVRGGSLEKPPGLGFFNEARARLGSVVAEMELENVQIFLLSALYYGACSRHVEFWRMIIAASTTCQSMITANVINWGSQRWDLVRRAHWHCKITENALRIELDLPIPSVQRNEDWVEFPTFSGPFSEADDQCNEISQFKRHYEAQIALNSLFAYLNVTVNESTSTTMDTPSNSDDPTILAASNLRLLTSQLDEWLSLLPPELRWPEDDPTVFPETTNINISHFLPLDPSLSTGPEGQKPPHLFMDDLDGGPVRYPYVYDIQNAFLRTRFYYGKYVVSRPFVYKALHFPDQMTPSDMQGVEDCLKSCLKWPIALSPVSRHKRLVPQLFCWTQAFFGILLILYLSERVPTLRKVRDVLGDTFESDAAHSIDLMLDWIRDLKSTDPLAGFCFNVLSQLYDMDSLRTEQMEEDP